MARPPIPPPLASILRFLQSESAGGILLIGAALVGLIWANSPMAPLYSWVRHLRAPIPGFTLTLHDWINDGMMVLFFLLVGLELRREMTEGELASLDRLAAPAFGAIGGMLLPACIFLAFNRGDPNALRGWAVPIATDIAFALAVISVLGARVPVQLKIFLTALAIIDDLGAIVVIALFYTDRLDFRMLGLAAFVLLCLAGLNRFGERRVHRYLAGGAVLWMLVLHSGIHATLAGVALAFVIPMRAWPNEAESPALRLEHGLHPWIAYLVLPLFGAANAGLRFSGLPPDAVTSSLAIGTALGLVVGKQLGVFGGVTLATRLGLATPPEGVGGRQLYGVAILCGVGFTMSLFIADLAFPEGPYRDVATLAVFIGSVVSALLGLVVLAFGRRPSAGD